MVIPPFTNPVIYNILLSYQHKVFILFLLLPPFFLLKERKHQNRYRNHNNPYYRIHKRPVQLWHILEVHAIQPHNER